MAVTEFAILPLLRIPPGGSPLSPTLITKLAQTKQVLEQASGYSFYYFRQIKMPPDVPVEDSALVFIIGRWDSVAAHNAFLPSTENQKLLALIKDEVDLEKITMFHLDIDVFESENISIADLPTLNCIRSFVPAAKKTRFQEIMAELRKLSEAAGSPIEFGVGGWRIDKEAEEKEEWLMLGGNENLNPSHEQQLRRRSSSQKSTSMEEILEGVRRQRRARTAEYEKFDEMSSLIDGAELFKLQRIEGL